MAQSDVLGRIAAIVGLGMTTISALIVFLDRPVVHIRAEPNPVLANEPVILSWEVQNADLVTLEGLEAQPSLVETAGRRIVRVAVEKTFVLRASSRWLQVLRFLPFGTTVGSATVTLLQPPEVHLVVDRPVVSVGDSVTLRWDTVRSQNVSLRNGGESPVTVSPSGTLSVRVLSTTRFRIDAANRAGTSHDGLVVTARFEPRLWAEPVEVSAGEKTTISWNAEGADSVMIAPFGTVPTSGSREIEIDQSRSFDLIASLTDRTSKRVTLIVPARVEPRIWAEPSELDAGESVLISWQARGAEQAEITGLGPVAAVGSRRLAVVETTTFRLTARAPDSRVTASQVVVTARTEPEITADPTDVEAGGTTKLSWRAPGARLVAVTGLGNVERKGSRVVRVTKDAHFELTALLQNETGLRRASTNVTVHAPRLSVIGIDQLSPIAEHAIQELARASGYDVLASSRPDRGNDWKPDEHADYLLNAACSLDWKRRGSHTDAPGVAALEVTSVEARVALHLTRARGNRRVATGSGSAQKSRGAPVAPYGRTSGTEDSDLEVNATREAAQRAYKQLMSNLARPL